MTLSCSTEYFCSWCVVMIRISMHNELESNNCLPATFSRTITFFLCWACLYLTERKHCNHLMNLSKLRH